ncbi:hypothetical protein BpHYR1_008461 [Brachionus plicatilis]|uniref:Uncharacterized protein n=1 Tax=Brachionus plicatilis TaxID=10195 RepID=A0A3M7QKI8_BRAPC|nr:hypothetical protein BpHYR1_008461 [Brachionus plicatilis]
MSLLFQAKSILRLYQFELKTFRIDFLDIYTCLVEEHPSMLVQYDFHIQPMLACCILDRLIFIVFIGKEILQT